MAANFLKHAVTDSVRKAQEKYFGAAQTLVGLPERDALAEAEIASEIYSTAGDYDLLVKFYVDKDTDIGHFVNEKVQVIPGIQDTHTIITFKAFGTG